MSHEKNRKRLRNLIDERCLMTDKDIPLEAFTLNSGQRSQYYFDCKRALLDGDAAVMIADAFLEEIQRLPCSIPDAIGGPSLGAGLLASAIITLAQYKGLLTLSGSIVRRIKREHGMMALIENPQPEGTRICIMDDVLTTGNSITIACDQFITIGYNIIGIVILIDRETGAMKRLSNQYQCPVRAIFKKYDFPRIACMS